MKAIISSPLFVVFLLFCSVKGISQPLAPTEDQALFKIQATRMNGSPRAQEKIQVHKVDDATSFELTTNHEGNCEILLDKGAQYKVANVVLNNVKEVSAIPVPNEVGLLTFTVKVAWDMAGSQFALKDIYYDTGKATLRPNSYPTLNALYDYLTNHPNVVIEIRGHTDAQGSETSNQTLSQNRAQSVRQYLQRKGIPSEQLQANGFGESLPVASNDNETGRQQNRRTEVRFVSE